MNKPKDSKKAILDTQWTVTLHPLAERELQTIPADMQARFLHIGEMLEELGPQRVGLPHIRPLESKLWEMRMTGRDGIARAVYAAVHGRTLLVLHVFVKKTQTTPRSAIEIALKRLEEST
jgi:phage-related protein